MRIPVGGTDSRRGSGAHTPTVRDGTAVTPPCELPAPTDQGRIYSPPHPIFSIAFVYAVSLALTWGALTRAEDPTSRLAMTFLALCACLVAAVHWIDAVELAHAPAKLGVRPAPARAWWIAAAASTPGLVWVGRLALGTEAFPGAGAAASGTWSVAGRTLALLAAAAWYEAFYRGFVFRSLMRRHGFVTSAAISAALLSAATMVVSGPPYSGEGAVAAALVELPLSFVLCALFWLFDQSLGPAWLVRVAVLACTWWTGSVWPALAAATLIVFLVRVWRPRPPALNKTVSPHTAGIDT